jgi:hypothetical protein
VDKVGESGVKSLLQSGACTGFFHLRQEADPGLEFKSGSPHQTEIVCIEIAKRNGI